MSAAIRVIETVASLEERHGGPSRTVPALSAALCQQGVEAQVHAWDRDRWPEVRPDLLHDHGIWLPTNHRTARMTRSLRIPRVVSVHGMLEPWAMAYRRWKKRLAWVAYQRRDLAAAAVIHVTSVAEAQSIRRLGLVNPLTIIPNGVEIPASLAPRPATDRRRALFLSRVHQNKGLSMLIAAWAAVRPRGWELVIAGPDEHGHRAELEGLIRQAGLVSSVRFFGPVSDTHKWLLYRSADLFVLPTHSENFGLVVAEALAAEIPVITTKGAPWEELETHACGWWTDIRFEAIAAALGAATALSGEQRREMGARGRRLIEERYSWTRAAVQMKAVYLWLLGRGGLPDCMRPA